MKKSWMVIAASISALATCGAMVLLYLLPLDLRERSPLQPISFSHKLHAGSHAIPCLYCHRLAGKSSLAGIPAVADCLACHRYIVPDAAEIIKLRGYLERKEAIPWARVHLLPDHVYFPHMMHLRARVDCTFCHGNVVTMERISRTASLKMGWCLGCHRQHKASIDCWTCHI